MKTKSMLWSGALLLMAVGLLGGCKQGEGEACSLNADCKSGLSCCITPDRTAIIMGQGTCQKEGNCEISNTDASVSDARVDSSAEILDALVDSNHQATDAARDGAQLDASGLSDAAARD